MTEHQFDVMLHAIHLGDGSKQKNQSWTRRSYHINTGNKTFAERLQIMAIMRGYKANISEQFYNRNPLYLVHLKKKQMANIAQSYDSRPVWQKEKYTPEECWCVENELGTIVTRRNGKVAIVGNCQMIGRGTRLFPGKQDLLLLDFLWHSERHELCRPSHLVCDNPDLSKRVSEIMAEESQDGAIDLLDAEEKAESSAAEEREESLRKLLEEQRHRKRALVDPLQYEMSIGEQLENYSPDMKDLRALAPPSTAQLAMLEKFGISPDDVTCQGHASRLIETVQKRRAAGLTTPKQIRFLERRGFNNVGRWEFNDAKRLIDRIAAHRWRVPNGINPKTYMPAGLEFVAGGAL